MSHTSRFVLGGGLVALAGMGLVSEAQAQAFAEVKSAQVDYSKADFEPHLTCEDLGKYQSADIAETVAFMAAVPRHVNLTEITILPTAQAV